MLLSDDKLLLQWKKNKSTSAAGLSTQYRLAREAHQFNAGDDMAYQASVMDKGRKKMVIFNKIKPFIDAVSGFMIQLRREPEYFATIQDNQKQEAYSTLVNGVSKWARDNANLPHIESKQDKEMLIAGYGAVETNIMYMSNPDGEVQGELIEYDDIGWDPLARETNVLDSRWVFRRKKYTLDEALQRFPGSKPTDFEGVTEETSGAYEYNPSDGIYTKIASGAGSTEHLVEIYYYQYWTLDTYYRLANPLAKLPPDLSQKLVMLLQAILKKRIDDENDDDYIDNVFEFDPMAETLVMGGQLKKDVVTFFETIGLNVEVQEHLKKCYYTAVITGKKVLQHFKSPHQKGFTIKFKTMDYDKHVNAWYGMVRQLIEPSKYANKSLTEMLYVIASNSKGGVMYEVSAVEDPELFEQQYATTNSAIQVADGALGRGAIMPKAQAKLPDGYADIYEISDAALKQVSGVNPEFLGSSENKQVSALLESQRINQVVSTLAGPFDAIALYQKEHARLMLTYIRMLVENAPGRIIRIVDETGTPNYVQLTEDKLASEYDVDIGESPTSATQKTETFNLLVEMAKEVSQQGINIWPIVIEEAPFKQKTKAKLIQAMTPQPNPQDQMMKQQMQQIALMGHKAKVAKDVAETGRTNQLAQKDHADTAKVLVEAQQTSIENHLMKHHAVDKLNVSV